MRTPQGLRRCQLSTLQLHGRTGVIQPLRGIKVGNCVAGPMKCHCLPAQYMDEAYDSMVDVGILKLFVTIALGLVGFKF